MTDDSNIPVRIADAEGSMEHAPLVYALVHALDRAITGEMVFCAPDGEAHTITFFEGAPVRVEPGPEGDRIGDELVAMDHVSEDALAEALVTSQSSRKRLGELLVAAGVVDPPALTNALALQTAKRLALLANLPATSTFALYFSARAEPEPLAPWAPLDLLLATIRAWEDRSRLRGTLRWLADKTLHLNAESDLEALMLTSREREAIGLMRRDSPSLRTLYATVGKGLSSLLYMLAVTRQFSFSKGTPMGRRKQSDLVHDAVQVAVPIAPVIVSASDVAGDQDEEEHRSSSVPPAPEPLALDPVDPPPAPAAPAAQPAQPTAGAAQTAPPVEPAQAAQPLPAPHAAPPPRARVSVPAGTASPTAPPPPVRRLVSIAPPPLAPPPRPSAPPAPVVAPPPVTLPPPPRAPARPSFSPPKFVDPGTPQARIPEGPSRTGSLMSPDFALAEDAARRQDYQTADRLLRERCTDEDAAEPDFQALAAWVKANLRDDAKTALNDLTFLLMAHNTCERALYYRGLLLKRTGKEKAALRDFVTLAKQNPSHMAALAEVKLLRELVKKS